VTGLRGWWPIPDDDVRAEVGAVRPDESTRLDADLAKTSLIGADRFKNGAAEKFRKIALDDRTVRQLETYSVMLEDLDLSDAYQRHRDPPSVQRRDRVRYLTSLSELPVSPEFFSVKALHKGAIASQRSVSAHALRARLALVVP